MTSAPVREGSILAGKYEVERVLGSGGMGVVVAARHVQLGERVAIKFLLPQAVHQADVVARFLREGQASARIKSEHVARVFDVGTLDDGAPYLVMEYLDGIDLGARVKQFGPVPLPEAIELVLQACEALAEAHALGIVHRDLKPANLFLTQRSDGSPCLKVIDFGISKVMGQGDTGVTASAIMMGSPLFMAPEQMKSARDVDARADVWSLGGILFTIATGKPPHPGESVMEIYERILEGVPRLEALVPGAPAAVGDVIVKCLKKEAAERFQDVGALALSLAPFAAAGAERAARAARVLGGRGVAPAASYATPTAAPAPSLPPSPEVVTLTPSAVPLPSNTPLPARSGPPGASEGPWNQAPRPRSRAPLIAVAIAILLVGGGAAALVFRGGAAPTVATSDAAPRPPPAASVTVAPTAEGRGANPRDEEPAPSAFASAAPAASASASAPEPPAPSPSASAPKKPAPRPRLPAGPTKKRDLFGDPQ